MFLMSFAAFSCSRPTQAAGNLPQPEMDLPKSEDKSPQSVVLAGGCFWCVEAVFEQLDGVNDVISGYAGGTEDTATYKKVSEGNTNHAEVVQVIYDPSKITFGQILRVFFSSHNPTQLNQQGPDRGKQYRSAIFYKGEDQKRVAELYIKQLNDAKAFKDPIVTTLEPLEKFYTAEEYHQDFVGQNPHHPYVQQWAIPKVEKVQKEFADQVKDKAKE